MFPFAPLLWGRASVVVSASVTVSVEEAGAVAGVSCVSPISAFPTGEEPQEARVIRSAAEAASAVSLFVFILSFSLDCIFE